MAAWVSPIELFNVLVMLLEYTCSAALILFFLRFMKREGAYVALATLIIASNVGVAKIFRFLNLEVTAANMSMGMAFVIYSVVTEVYGPHEGRKAVWVGFASQFAFVILGGVYATYVPSDSDLAHGYLTRIFTLTPRIALASWSAFLLSGYVAVWVHHALRGKTKLWLRNNVATKLGQLVDNIVFVTIAFAGRVAPMTLVGVLVSTTVVEFILDYLDTWIVYVGVRLLRYEGTKVPPPEVGSGT